MELFYCHAKSLLSLFFPCVYLFYNEVTSVLFSNLMCLFVNHVQL